MTTINKYSRWIGGVAYLVNAYIHSEMFADNLYIVTVDDLDHVDSIEEIETTAEDLEKVFNDTVKKYQDIYDAENHLVSNMNGTKINYESAVELMDDDIREYLHRTIAPCTEQEFFTAYEAEHKKKYGEVWELSKDNPVW